MKTNIFESIPEIKLADKFFNSGQFENPHHSGIIAS